MKKDKEEKKNRDLQSADIIIGEEKEQKKISKKIIILFCILIAIFGISLTPITLQNDTFYTIEIGEHISENGIDMQDPFSWHEDLEYTYPHWLYDYITYIVYSMFGFTGIYVGTCILTAILGISMYLVSAKLTRNHIIAFIITIAAMYVIRGQIAARAQLVTFILFVWSIFFIEKFLKTKKIGYAIPLVIIPIIIANMHLAVFPFYFVLFLPYIAEYLIANISEWIIYRKSQKLRIKLKIRYLEKRIKKEILGKRSFLKLKKDANILLKELKEKLEKLENKIDKIRIKRTKNLQKPYKIKIRNNKNIKWLILVMIIAVFTGFLTPLGTTPYTYLINTMQGNTMNHINEHLPMYITTSTEAMCIIIIFLAIMIFTKTKIRLADLFMFGGLTYLMLDSRRQISMVGIIGSIVICRLIVDFIKEDDENVLDGMYKLLKSKLTIGVIISVIIFLSVYMYKDKIGNEYVNEKIYPVQASEYILKNLNLEEIRLFNEYNYGSYLLFKDIPVFIDSRADLYAPEFSGKEEDIFMDFIETSNLSKYYEDIFEKYDMTHVILYKNSKVNMIIEETEKRAEKKEYYELYSDDNFIIYQIIK